MKKVFSFLCAIVLYTSSFAQAPEGVDQLIAAENYFNLKVQEKGLKKAFISVSDNNTIAFRPSPLLALKYYKEQPDSIGYLRLNPVLAKISKSNDWGFTAGPYTYKQSESDDRSFYGTYISVWKKNNRGVWRLAMDAGVAHKKPVKTIPKKFITPSDASYIHQKSDKRLQQREDIVYSSDKLMSTIMKADNKIAQTEFLTEDSWLLFPGFEPMTNKKAIMEFWKKQGYKALTYPIKADRSVSGEIAYTYGTSTILAKKYNYIRVWEVQPNYKWNVIVEVFTEEL
ncbi:cysteinyl-tRNA synthetase [Arcticibacter svalbardensis MN12-7]|uniref:Cysteinyl-tRNA synthetase n=1 Tax=Arcticibacter svalbardensis MN12-7 TaxID=1150600 RepID=R9GLQ6_9SPHI|nr:hypothetical protein [Arcticibacter svalbardensis]EOR92626.1 cysteinyl-tRNA synthetase [Arcticibacter svalbardensis MN12-7]